MGRGQMGPAVHQLQRLFGESTIAASTEWQLLRRYLERRDEVAFEAIVKRHGPMVLGVCRRVLTDPRDVEDAFQATFLILAKKGESLDERDPIGHWLYGVAYRISLRARSSAARRRNLERSAPSVESEVVDDPGRRELRSVMDEELAKLPSKYRAPVVLCYLEGQTHEDAGRVLGWPVGTVKGRLSRAREILKNRLTRRGVAPTTGAVLLALVREARADVPASLLNITTKAAMAGRTAGVVPASVTALMAGSLSTMFLNHAKMLGAIALVLGTGAAVLAFQGTQGPNPAPKPQPAQAPSPEPPATPTSDWIAGWPSLTNPTEVNPKNQLILGSLDDAISMNFPNDTPLEDVVKYIQQSTQSKTLPNGIPIYVDPLGLQDSDKTMASTVSINLEGTPLKVTLDLALKQIGLTYKVKNGLLMIVSRNADSDETPVSIMLQKAERGELTREEYQQLIEMLKLRNQVDGLIIEKHKGGGFQ